MDYGNYSAVGKTADGKEYDIIIEQKPGGIRFNWNTPQGETGSGAFGTFVEQ